MTNKFHALKRSLSVVTLAAFLSVSGTLVPVVTEAAPMPRGVGIHRVAQHRPGPSPHFRRPPVHRPPVQREIRRRDPRPWRPVPQIHHPGPHQWRPGPHVWKPIHTPPPPPRPSTRDRRIARGLALLGVAAALFAR